MCIYEMSAFPDIFLRGNKKKKNMSMSPTGPVGRILPTLSAVGDMSATCRRHAQLRQATPTFGWLLCPPV
jgi:hypothetical protein